MQKQWFTSSLKDLDPASSEIAASLKAGDILLVKGQVGAGKTTLVNSLVRHWGGGESNSPTFAIHNYYKTNTQNVHHLDLYRLESEDDLLSVGIEDFLQDKDSVTIIEWPERLPKSFLPRHRKSIELEIRVKGAARELLWREL